MNGPTSNSPYAGSGFVSQVEAAADAVGMYVNRDDRSEYIELNRDGTFLQYERSGQSIGRYTLNQGALRVAFSDGRTAQMYMHENYFTDQQGRTWVKKERTRPSAPLAPSYAAPLAPSYPVQQSARNPAIIWVSVIAVVSAFTIVATQWSNIKRLLKKSPPPLPHYSESHSEWRTHSVTETGITAELPDYPVRFPAKYSHCFVEMKAYADEYDNLQYMLIFMITTDEIISYCPVDVEDKARKGMESFKNNPRVDRLKYDIKKEGSGFVSISGTCIYSDKAASVEGMVKIEGRIVWSIFTISRTNDREARAAAKRIISSVKFKQNQRKPVDFTSSIDLSPHPKP